MKQIIAATLAFITIGLMGCSTTRSTPDGTPIVVALIEAADLSQPAVMDSGVCYIATTRPGPSELTPYANPHQGPVFPHIGLGVLECLEGVASLGPIPQGTVFFQDTIFVTLDGQCEMDYAVGCFNLDSNALNVVQAKIPKGWYETADSYRWFLSTVVGHEVWHHRALGGHFHPRLKSKSHSHEAGDCETETH